ncbi:c-type cytochrome [Caldovatus aquaticus]|uniref:Cytochrome c family protein n=1 Tax=Caldovatus aquaticus TaxID=2865671 RepID=A0ABS7F3X1_9PROT|nr:cytochrome c family protein [Caldovatus aquaticus]MBW8270303.1 cytochrome c family protein [Caldovatus aquaticus]
MAFRLLLPIAAALAGSLALAPAPARAQDPAAGQRVFNQCRACHTIEQGGRNSVGPNLHGLFGRRAGSVEGFRYSADMREKGEGGLVWNEETLRAYLANPKAVVPRGTMSFVGLRNEQQLADLIAYLRQAAGSAN